MSAFTAALNLPLDALRPRLVQADGVASKERVVVRLFEAFSQRSLQDVLSLLTEDVVFTPMTAQVTRAGEPYRGHDGMLSYIADVEQQWDELVLRPTQIKAAGNAVVALGLVSGRGATGEFEDAPTTWMFKFRGEQVAQIQIFSERSHVIEALGEERASLGDAA
ncbi:MAG TPA: nuclear transport factor 2 family protein [Solirubrobacteraceae bacterium]|nr:nuclear transport factor 2 family protein [Solirubrobacteraceae bacterium]